MHVYKLLVGDILAIGLSGVHDKTFRPEAY